ncbi:SDR family NAD(P)-dependent oxidoreductase [Streptomyces nigra]|uniref:SDR family NAD(P)-dependent oxidoreductase n=1 Tax=Streptomyces nigra TaxID=1827580 RepID=UPI0035D68BD5
MTVGACVVVGAGPGLGAAAARLFGREGYSVGLVARDVGHLESIAGELTAAGVTTATATADVTDQDALTRAIGSLRERLGPIEVVLFSPRPSLAWIKPVLDTTPTDLESALDLNVVGAATVVRAVVPEMRERRSGTLLFTTGGAAVDPHRDRAVSGVAYAAESAYTRMLHDALAGDGVHAAQLTIVGATGAGALHDPDDVARQLWRLHSDRDEPLLILR